MKNTCRNNWPSKILQAAYQAGYGKLLDLLDSKKWQALKRLQLMRNPVYATLLGHTFWLSYSEKAEQVLARTVLKSLEEAQRLVQAFLQPGKNIHLVRPENG